MVQRLTVTEITERYPTSECDCHQCVSMCERIPCWPSPQEARDLIESGYGRKLMHTVDYDYRIGYDIELICPAPQDYTPGTFTSDRYGVCVFLTNDDLCQIHNTGFKPIEARLVDHRNAPEDLHLQVLLLWDTPEGKEVIKLWQNMHINMDN